MCERVFVSLPSVAPLDDGPRDAVLAINLERMTLSLRYFVDLVPNDRHKVRPEADVQRHLRRLRGLLFVF